MNPITQYQQSNFKPHFGFKTKIPSRIPVNRLDNVVFRTLNILGLPTKDYRVVAKARGFDELMPPIVKEMRTKDGREIDTLLHFNDETQKLYISVEIENQGLRNQAISPFLSIKEEGDKIIVKQGTDGTDKEKKLFEASSKSDNLVVRIFSKLKEIVDGEIR